MSNRYNRPVDLEPDFDNAYEEYKAFGAKLNTARRLINEIKRSGPIDVDMDFVNNRISPPFRRTIKPVTPRLVDLMIWAIPIGITLAILIAYGIRLRYFL